MCDGWKQVKLHIFEGLPHCFNTFAEVETNTIKRFLLLCMYVYCSNRTMYTSKVAMIYYQPTSAEDVMCIFTFYLTIQLLLFWRKYILCFGIQNIQINFAGTSTMSFLPTLKVLVCCQSHVNIFCEVINTSRLHLLLLINLWKNICYLYHQHYWFTSSHLFCTNIHMNI